MPTARTGVFPHGRRPVKRVPRRPLDGSLRLDEACARGMRRLGMISATLALTTLGVGTARPEPMHPRERVRISYSAPAECPDQTAFEAGVSDRLSRPWKAAAGELARTIRIVVTKERGLLVARMAFTDAMGRSVSRAVSAETCDEVVSGIALVTALAIQSQVFGEEGAAPGTPPASTGPAAAPSAPTAMVAPARPPPASHPSALAHDVGLRFGVATGLGPRLATAVGVLWG